jgi:hypothetical protein
MKDLSHIYMNTLVPMVVEQTRLPTTALNLLCMGARAGTAPGVSPTRIWRDRSRPMTHGYQLASLRQWRKSERTQR